MNVIDYVEIYGMDWTSTLFFKLKSNKLTRKPKKTTKSKKNKKNKKNNKKNKKTTKKNMGQKKPFFYNTSHGPMAAPQYAPALTVVNLGTVCEWFALYASI